MAENSGAEPQQGGGNAVGGLTPLTVKFPESPESEKTQIGPAPSSSGARSVRSLGTPTLVNETGAGNSTVHADIVIQDLLTERLLKDAPRVDHNGKLVPALNGIPLLTKIGQGGMGAVYFGVHPRLRCEVAVKVLPFHLAEQDPDMIRRFFREAQIAAQVRSPHLVNVMDVNEESGLFFLVMEYVPGASAGHLVKSVVASGHVGLPVLDALDIAIAATEGLHAAHSQGIIHRDLKPDNIMVPYLARETKKYNLKASKLMDLGLARSEESNNQSLTGVQAAMGTPGYMAPEQALDAKTANRASDVFGMGATLYAFLTGHAPFRNEAVMKVLMATMHEPHEPVIKARPEVPAILSEIVDKCLDKKQENRYADAQTLNRALKNCRRALGGVSADEGEAEGVDMAALSGSKRSKSLSVTGVIAPASQATILTGQNGNSQATMVTNAGVTTSTGGRKGMMLVAAAVIAVLAIGGAIVAFTRKPKVDPGIVEIIDNGGGKDPGLVVKDPTFKQWTHDDVESSQVFTIPAVQKIESSLTTHNLGSAKNLVARLETELNSIPPSGKIDPKEKDVISYRQKLEDDILRFKEAIVLEEKRNAYGVKLKNVDEFSSKGDFDKALSELKAAGAILSTPEAKTELQARSSTIQDKIADRDNRKKFDEFMVSAAKFEKTEPEKSLIEIRKALELIPGDADASRREVSLKKSIDLVKNKAEYAKKMIDSKAAEENKLFDRALELAYAARDLLPEETLAKETISRIEGVLGDVKRVELREKQRKENNNKLAVALKEGGEFADKNDWEKAGERVKDASELFQTLQLNPDSDKRVSELQKRIEDGIVAQRNSVEAKRKQAKFNKIFESVSGCVTMDSWDNDATTKAQGLIAELKTLDAQNTKIAEIETKLNNRVGYETAVKLADEAIQKEKLDVADKQIKAALCFMPEGSAAKKLSSLLKGEQERIAARERKLSFDKLMVDATAAEKKDDLKEAVAKIVEAKKLFTDDKALLEMEKRVQKKISDREASAKQREDIRNAFNVSFADVDKLEPEDADSKLNDYKTKMVDTESFKKELGLIETKRAELKGKLAQRLEGIIATGLKQVKDRLPTSNDLAAALTELQALDQKYPKRKDITDRIAGVSAVKQAASAVAGVIQDYNGKVVSIKGRVKGGEVEKGNLDAAQGKLRERLRALVGQALENLVKADLLDTNVSSALNADRKTVTAEVDGLLAQLEAIYKSENKKPEPPPETKQPDKKPAKQGEIDVFDQ